ncbi:hypothetical protein AAHN97_22295 [Chitinophaga niabensis]|uniref:hypothetical protein n=1 Tax=Chitinophaga niabensis TaxID=536979 RepID=UPI0031BB431F
MSNITLADYVGFIFSEITRARDHADKVSKDLAIAYSKDEVLKHFAVPRFKIPEMELTIPVLISSAKFSTTMLFNMQEEEFKKYVAGKVNAAIQTLLIKSNNVETDYTGINNEVFTKPVYYETALSTPPQQTSRLSKNKKVARLPGGSPQPTAINVMDHPALPRFYQQLVSNQDPAKPDNIALLALAEIFNAKINEYGLQSAYRSHYPNNELFQTMLTEVIQKIKENTMVSASKMENLLVNPETNLVKSGSSDTTVFTIKAKIMEEGLFVKTVKNEETGKEELLVEFE